MRVPPDEYLALHLRAHELLRDVPLYDVSIVDLPGGGEGRTLADIRALDEAAPPSRISRALYGLRYFLGRLFGWDRKPIRPEQSFVSRLAESDRRDSTIVPGTREGAFIVLYELSNEAVRETRNATVHGFISTALRRRGDGYRLYLAIYVERVSWITKPYLIAIEPFRRVLYPAMLRRIRLAWMEKYPIA
jgi:hypothetical protein